jgi:hypothetical protein
MWVLALVLGLALAQPTPPNCNQPYTARNPAGQTFSYDLRQFAQPPGDKTKFIAGKEALSSWTAYLNICGTAKVVGCTEDAPICQDDNAGNYFTFGTAASWTAQTYYEPTVGPGTPLPDKGVVVTTSGGQLCTSVGVQRQATMFFRCDATVTTMPTTAVIAEQDPVTRVQSTCKYFFSPLAYQGFCPGSGGGGDSGFDYGWVFVIIVLCGLFLYFVVGMIILKFAQHKEGREIVPQADFWFALPGLVLDGLKYALCCVPCRGSSYTTV